MKPGLSGIFAHVHDVDAVPVQTGQDQLVSRLAGVVMATGAGVPPRVVKLITGVGDVQSVDHLHNHPTIKVTCTTIPQLKSPAKASHS